jgi:hypothetical protein
MATQAVDGDLAAIGWMPTVIECIGRHLHNDVTVDSLAEDPEVGLRR